MKWKMLFAAHRPLLFTREQRPTGGRLFPPRLFFRGGRVSSEQGFVTRSVRRAGRADDAFILEPACGLERGTFRRLLFFGIRSSAADGIVTVDLWHASHPCRL